MKRKLFTLLFSIMTGMAMANTEKIQIGNLYYNIDTQSKTASVTYKSSSYDAYNDITEYNKDWLITTANIPAIIENKGISYTVTCIGEHAFCGCSRLTSIEIPNSITSIEKVAFSSCSGLTSIDLPNSITSIGSYAFNGCSGLTSVEIPNSVTSIGTYAFAWCTSLTSITIPDSVRSIGYGAFYDCNSLPVIDNLLYADIYLVGVIDKSMASYTIKDGTKFIGGSAFSGCTNLVSVKIPNSVTSIGSSAFSGCTSLTSIEIPNSVTSIESEAFSGCTSLTSIEIPNSIKSIGSSAFSGCTGITSVIWNAINCAGFYNGHPLGSSVSSITSFTLGDNVEYIPAYLCYKMDKLKTITIPNSVTSIGDDAFSGCSGLTSIEIPNSVTYIGYRAFDGCSSLPVINNIRYAGTYLVEAKDKSLTSCIIKEGTKYIGHKAFSGCTSLTSIEIPNSIKSIGGSAFLGCTNLVSVEIPNSVISIGNDAFRNCSSLSSVTIPNSVTSIESHAFWGCTGLTSVIWNAINISDFTDYTQPFGTSVSLITFGDDVEHIPAYLCYKMDKLEKITIPNSVESIGEYAFYHCTALTSVIIGNSVNSIGKRAFDECSGVTSLAWNAKKCSYGEAFSSSVTSVTFGDKVEYIPNNLCKNMNNLTSITIPNSVKEIGDYAFNNCAGLRTVNMGNQVQSIGAHAFENCSRVNTINLPNTLTYIGTDAFKNTPFISSEREWEDGIHYINTCVVGSNPNEVLTEPILREGTTAIYQGAFKGCYRIVSINLPEITSIPNDAFSGCTSLTSIEIPNSVTSIGTSAFEDCKRLTAITIPDSVTSIGIMAFKNCADLKSIVWNAKKCECQMIYLPSTSDGKYYDFFSGIRSRITSFTFGNNVEKIPVCLCTGMKNLDSISIPNSVTGIEKEAFSGCTNISAIHIGNNVKEIGSSAFSGCSSLKQITIGHAVETIGDNAFDQCPNVMTIYSYLKTPPVINSTVFAGFGTYKGVDLFVPVGTKANYEAMDYWKDFYIIEGLPDIIDNKLHYTLDEKTQTATLITSSLAELKPVIDGELIIPDTVVSNGKTYIVTAIGNSVFKDNSTIITVIIPSSVTQIGDSAFYGSSITSVIIGGTEIPVTNNSTARRIVAEDRCCSIGAYAFANCKELTEITFPKCVNSIGKGAFKDCSALTSINSEMQTPPSIDGTVFEGCGNLGSISLVVPVGSEDTYKNMAVWKEFLLNKEVKTYTITFINWDGTELLKLSNVKEGSMPEYTGETPTRPEDKEYTYTFSGWSPAIVVVSADATYTATYEAKKKSQAIDQITNDQLPATTKVLRDGQILILRGEKVYTVTGQEVK